MDGNKLIEYVKDWMLGFGDDTFIENERGEVFYKSECRTHGINVTLYMADLLEDFIDALKEKLEVKYDVAFKDYANNSSKTADYYMQLGKATALREALELMESEFKLEAPKRPQFPADRS